MLSTNDLSVPTLSIHPSLPSTRAQESMMEANRSRARMANAWQMPGKAGKSSKRAAAVAASEAISAVAEIELSVGDEAVSGSGGGGGSGGGAGGSSNSGSKKRASASSAAAMGSPAASSGGGSSSAGGGAGGSTGSVNAGAEGSSSPSWTAISRPSSSKRQKR